MGQAVKIPSRPVPWQDFQLVPLSLCPRTMKGLLSLCLAGQENPIPLETLKEKYPSKIGKFNKSSYQYRLVLIFKLLPHFHKG